MAEQPETSELLALTTNIVASHVSNNSVTSADLPQLIQQVYSALSSAGSGGANASAPRPQPAVSIKKYNMTPDDYRERWGLGPDYPMVAPNYAAQRSTLAKKIGLGTKRRAQRRRV
jgi:predicted transcriptional regulator